MEISYVEKYRAACPEPVIRAVFRRSRKMGWTSAEWSCGHTGEMQLYGKMSERDSRIAYEAGRKCMACWLVEQWGEKADPRAMREDKFNLARSIAAGKAIRIKE
jgi:hypothetical protein